MNNNVVRVGAIVGVVALVLVVWWNWRSPNNENFPEGLDYVCLNQGCGHTWNMSMKDYGDFQRTNYGQRVPCPNCKQQNTSRAEKCPNCAKVIAMQRGGGTCPHCKKPLMPGLPPSR